jgi:pimeloyl-ACP methyl ester carboxylesterase
LLLRPVSFVRSLAQGDNVSQGVVRTTAYEETVALFEATGGPLTGVISRPAVQPSRGAVLLCGGGWYGTITNRNRIYVRLARSLAIAGYDVLRFDWHGVGESTGHIDQFDLDSPFVEDVMAAGRYLRSQSQHDPVLVGVCFGARAALAAAHAGLPLSSLVLVSFPVPKPRDETRSEWYTNRLSLRDLARAAFQSAIISAIFDANARRVYRKAVRMKWRSVKASLGLASASRTRIRTRLTAQDLLLVLVHLHDRNVPTFFLFGEDDLALHSFALFSKGPLSSFLAETDSLVTIARASGHMHSFDTLASQDEFVAQVEAWITDDRPNVTIGA